MIIPTNSSRVSKRGSGTCNGDYHLKHKGKTIDTPLTISHPNSLNENEGARYPKIQGNLAIFSGID